jgi:hypothetical protein
MACRRVLSSTPLLVRGSETGGDSGERKLTNNNYKYKNMLESGKQVVGPISAQTLVDWRLGECGNKFTGVTRIFIVFAVLSGKRWRASSVMPRSFLLSQRTVLNYEWKEDVKSHIIL